MRTRLPILCLLTTVVMVHLSACEKKEAAPSTSADRPVEVPPITGEMATAFHLIEAGDTGPARIRLRQWMEANGHDARALFLFGLAYHRERLYSSSADWFSQATKATPTYPPAWHFLGWSSYYLGRPEDAKTAFREHLLLSPNEGDSFYGLGLIMLDTGQMEEAEVYFNQAVALQRDHPERKDGVSKALVRLAEIHELQEQDASARALLEDAVAMHPDHYEAWYRLARVCRRLQDEQAAIVAEEMHLQARQRVRPKAGFPE